MCETWGILGVEKRLVVEHIVVTAEKSYITATHTGRYARPMRSMRLWNRHVSYNACFLLYMINHSVLMATAFEYTMAEDAVQTAPILTTHDNTVSATFLSSFIDSTPRPQTTPGMLNTDDTNISFVSEKDAVFAVSNAPGAFEAAILVQGSASMRLKADDLETYDNAIVQWHTYCEQYVEDVWQQSGHGASPLLLSFDWVQIDDTRLDVFFVGIYPLQGVLSAPTCLTSAQTLRNADTATDVCSRLTLGGFGQKLLSGGQATLRVTTAQNITVIPQYKTHKQVVQSIGMHRLSIGASFTETRQITAYIQKHALANIFDDSIVVSPIPLVTPVVNVVFEPDLQPIQ